jgi:phage FluMu protein Com
MTNDPHAEPDKSAQEQESDLTRIECPVCGSLLFRARIEGEAMIEIKCDRCRSLRFLSFPVVDIPVTIQNRSLST